MSDLHRSDVQEDTGCGIWVEACPLPFYGIRKQCECGRKFWRESIYRKHWRLENARALSGWGPFHTDTASSRIEPLP